MYIFSYLLLYILIYLSCCLFALCPCCCADLLDEQPLRCLLCLGMEQLHWIQLMVCVLNDRGALALTAALGLWYAAHNENFFDLGKGSEGNMLLSVLSVLLVPAA